MTDTVFDGIATEHIPSGAMVRARVEGATGRLLVELSRLPSERDATAEEIRLFAVKAIGDERDRQDAKWGVQNHDWPTWLAVITEELGETSQEWLKGHFGGEPTGPQLITEMIQVAAVAQAFVECAMRNNWDMVG